MQQVLIYFFMAIGLSMDAFSLALAFGTNKPSFFKCLFTSLCVGIFHFLMPHIGSSIGTIISKRIILNSNIIVAIIFFALAIEMFLNRNEEKKDFIKNIFSIIFFAFSVSIDSLSVGIALGLTTSSIFLASLIFSITSAIFTLLGLFLGKKISDKLGNQATYLGIIILIILAFKYLI